MLVGLISSLKRLPGGGIIRRIRDWGVLWIAPALPALLEEIRARNIQIIVVYKVDRLSRSIIDFHKMMQECDKYGCNFVFITQYFDE